MSDTGTIMVGPIVGPAWGSFNLFDWGDGDGILGQVQLANGLRGLPSGCAGCVSALKCPLPRTPWRPQPAGFHQRGSCQSGRRTVNLLRAFNLRRGITPELERPSLRYRSTPVDGPCAGKSVIPHFEDMRALWYQRMGWDLESGRPLPETLEGLGLGDVVPVLWGRPEARPPDSPDCGRAVPWCSDGPAVAPRAVEPEVPLKGRRVFVRQSTRIRSHSVPACRRHRSVSP